MPLRFHWTVNHKNDYSYDMLREIRSRAYVFVYVCVFGCSNFSNFKCLYTVFKWIICTLKSPFTFHQSPYRLYHRPNIGIQTCGSICRGYPPSIKSTCIVKVYRCFMSPYHQYQVWQVRVLVKDRGGIGQSLEAILNLRNHPESSQSPRFLCGINVSNKGRKTESTCRVYHTFAVVPKYVSV